MSVEPHEVFAHAPMRWQQVLVVTITMALTGLDGFDVLAISFASPGISAEWHVDRATLGVVLSMELIGMSIGSVVLGRIADHIGRRPMMLICLILMAVGMFMATLARGVAELSGWRLLTGLGIGGMLATTNAVVAEFSSYRRRELGVSLMSIGYPLGATLGGMGGAALLRDHGWRSVFYLGTVLTIIFLPIVVLFVPESVHWLANKQPRAALERINRSLLRLGHAGISSLPSRPGEGARSETRIFSRELRAFTSLATVAYCFHIFTYYYILKWLPSIVVDMGFPAAAAAKVLVWTNVGGLAGGLLFGLVAGRAGLKRLTFILMLISSMMVLIFGRAPQDLARLSFICAGAGFCINAGIVGLYGIFARGFPTTVRASGTGFGIGVGRGGSVIAPIIAGILFRSGYGLSGVSAIMAVGSLISAAAVFALSYPRNEPA